MKIAHICLSLGKGGAEKLLVDNLPYYVEQGYEITIIQLSSLLEEPSYIDTVEKAGINIITLSKAGFMNPLIFLKLLKIIKANKFDILHVHLFPCFYYVSLAARLVRRRPILVFTEHCNVNRRITKKYLQPIEHFIYKKFDAIISISENVELILKNWIPRLSKKFRIIKNGVNIEKLQGAQAYDNHYFREHFHIGEHDVKLFMPARFNPQKDQETIVKALANLPEHFHILFAGDGSLLVKVRELAEGLHLKQRVHFLGFRTDIPELMKSVDINILSSFYEGFSGVTLEALAAGKPFLGSDVAGINDVVPNNDFLFEKQNPVALAKKIMDITNNTELKNRMIAEEAVHIKQFDIHIMIKQHINLYTQLLNSAAIK